MKYHHKKLTNTSVWIKLMPETDVETNILPDLDMANPEDEFTIQHYSSIMDYARFNYIAQPEDHIKMKVDGCRLHFLCFFS